MAEDADPLAFLSEAFNHTRKVVEAAFTKRCIPLQGHLLVDFSMSLEPPLSALYGQHSGPVEAVRSAAIALQNALAECARAAVLPVRSNERNVAMGFLSCLNNIELSEGSDAGGSLDDIVASANRAIDIGPLRRRGRPAELVYDCFVLSVEDLATQSGFCIDITRREGAYFGEFIELVFDIEKVLPSELRAGTESAVAERIMAARRRRGE